jgi:apolipoprotein N-acyltransferase
LVQTGWDMADYFDIAIAQGKQDYFGVAWDDVERLTREQAQGAQLIVWPEATVWHDLQVDAEARQRLATLAQEMKAYLFVPYFVEDWVKGHRNEAVLISPQGEFLGMYAKTHPIIFVGEQSITGGNFTVFPTPHGTLATMMAYDSDFPDVARTLTGKGAQLIAVTSHDWLEMSPFQVSMSVVRAAENRVTVVKADWRYGSAAIAPDGTILAATPSTRPLRQVLRVQVPVPATSGSLYTRLGDWVPMLCVLYLIGVVGSRLRRRPSSTNGRHALAKEE